MCSISVAVTALVHENATHYTQGLIDHNFQPTFYWGNTKYEALSSSKNHPLCQCLYFTAWRMQMFCYFLWLFILVAQFTKLGCVFTSYNLSLASLELSKNLSKTRLRNLANLLISVQKFSRQYHPKDAPQI